MNNQTQNSQAKSLRSQKLKKKKKKERERERELQCGFFSHLPAKNRTEKLQRVPLNFQQNCPQSTRLKENKPLLFRNPSKKPKTTPFTLPSSKKTK